MFRTHDVGSDVFDILEAYKTLVSGKILLTFVCLTLCQTL